MTAEIVNLRRARKVKVRADKAAKAATNRAKFGRTRSARELDAAREQLDARRLDAHKRDEPEAD